MGCSIDRHGARGIAGDFEKVRLAVDAGASAFLACLRGIRHGLLGSCIHLLVLVALGLHHASEARDRLGLTSWYWCGAEIGELSRVSPSM
eukprot:2200534-Alexandrium_andersonii.AAC.1